MGDFDKKCLSVHSVGVWFGAVAVARGAAGRIGSSVDVFDSGPVWGIWVCSSFFDFRLAERGVLADARIGPGFSG